MQQALELALDRAEYVIESARQRPPKRKYLSSGRKSVFQKLYDLYIEECEKEPEVKIPRPFDCPMKKESCLNIWMQKNYLLFWLIS